MALERMGTKSAANVIRNIEKSKANPLPRVLSALGIRFVGERTAVFLAEAFGSMDAIAAGRPGRTAARRGSGPEGGREHLPVFPRAAQPGTGGAPARRRPAIRPTNPPAPRAARLQGLTFVLTGTLPNLSREEAKRLIEAAGGKVSGCGQQEDQLRGGGRGCRLQAGESPGAGDPGSDRGQPAGADQGAVNGRGSGVRDRGSGRRGLRYAAGARAVLRLGA